MKMASQNYGIKKGSFNLNAMRGVQINEIDADNDFFMIPSE